MCRGRLSLALRRKPWDEALQMGGTLPVWPRGWPRYCHSPRHLGERQSLSCGFRGPAPFIEHFCARQGLHSEVICSFKLVTG